MPEIEEIKKIKNIKQWLEYANLILEHQADNFINTKKDELIKVFPSVYKKDKDAKTFKMELQTCFLRFQDRKPILSCLELVS